MSEACNFARLRLSLGRRFIAIPNESLDEALKAEALVKKARNLSPLNPSVAERAWDQINH